MVSITKSQVKQAQAIIADNKTPWVTYQDMKVTGIFSSRTQARDSKLVKVEKHADMVPLLKIEDVKLATKTVSKDFWENKLRKSTVDNATKVATELVRNMYGTAKPKEIFEEAYKQGIAYLTVRTMYQQYRESLK